MADKVDVKAVMAALPHLSETDRRQVKLRLQSLSSSDEAKGKSDSPAEESEGFTLFYSILSGLLREQGLPALPPFQVIRVSSPNVHRAALEGWRNVTNFVEVNFIDEPISNRDRVRLYNLFAEVLIWRLQEQEAELTVGTVLRGIYRVPAVIKMQFPGYVEAGCLSMILRMGKPTAIHED